MATWRFGAIHSVFNCDPMISLITRHSDCVNDNSAAIASDPPVKKHGAFTLVRELGAELLASLSMLDRFSTNVTGTAEQCTVHVSSLLEEPVPDIVVPVQTLFASYTDMTVNRWKPVEMTSQGGYVTRSSHKARRGVARRAVFSDLQRQRLEERFLQQKYISKPDRKKLAELLGLKDSQVKVWFQNRRMKWRNTKEREFLSSHRKFSTRDIPDCDVRKYLVDDA